MGIPAAGTPHDQASAETIRCTITGHRIEPPMTQQTTPPYIGVTGITAPQHAAHLLKAIDRSSIPHRIMCGVVLSNSLMQCRPTSHPNRYPAPASIPTLFASHPRLINLIHYRPAADGDIAQQLDTALALGGPNCHGLQVNTPTSMPWTPPQAIADFHLNHPNSTIVIQIGSPAFEHVKHRHNLIAEICRQYLPHAHRFIIDLSGGKALPINIRTSVAAAIAIKDAVPDASITFAGGISHHNVSAIISGINHDYQHDYSIDAEGALRTNDDQLDTNAATQYLSNAAAAFDRYHTS